MNLKTLKPILLVKSSLIFIIMISTLSIYALVAKKPKIIESKIEIWEGIGYQDDDSSWSIKTTFTNNKYRIDYPSLNCGGELIPLSISTSEYQFREKLSYGKTVCLDNGRLTITFVGYNSAIYSYVHPQGTAKGQLTRR